MIYEVTLIQSYFDQQVINRWNYLSSGAVVGIVPSVALTQVLGFVPDAGLFPEGTLARALQDIQVTTLQYVSVLTKAIREAPTDFYDFAFPSGVTGQDGGANPMSPTAALGFRSSRTRTDIARGTKRLAGISEPNVGAGGVLVPALDPLLEDIDTLMSTSFPYTDGGSSATFAPIIVQKEMYTTPPAKKAYRYYETIAEQLEHIAQGVVWTHYPQIRTQTSRQYGHGA